MVLNDFEDGDLVNVNGGVMDYWSGGGEGTYEFSALYNHTSPAGSTPGCLLVWMDRSAGDVSVGNLWNSSWGSTTQWDSISMWVRTPSGTSDYRIYGRDQNETSWNITYFTGTTSWQQVTSDRNGLALTTFKKVNIQVQPGLSGSLFVDDMIMEEYGY